jgi:hypothetical protein
MHLRKVFSSNSTIRHLRVRQFSDVQPTPQELLKHLISLSEDGKFAEEVGVGGLDHVFQDLFRRILVCTHEVLHENEN